MAVLGTAIEADRPVALAELLERSPDGKGFRRGAFDRSVKGNSSIT
jgi:hypothetical protein